jgi:hypothetical protein
MRTVATVTPQSTVRRDRIRQYTKISPGREDRIPETLHQALAYRSGAGEHHLAQGDNTDVDGHLSSVLANNNDAAI